MKISICIPAYKRIEYLERLFDSIAIQTFRDFEVIITDDSPDDSVGQLCELYSDKFLLQHFKNIQQLGTPENWNEGIRKASGEWIKIMHDDDWFADKDALKFFAEYADKYPESLIFSTYNNVYLPSSDMEKVLPSRLRLKQLKNDKSTLISKNIIGPPSVIMHKNDGRHFYDRRLKWLVDIDLYIRRLEDSDYVLIEKPLVNVGVSREQVTAMVHGVADIEIPEHFIFLEKYGIKPLRNILVYDYWWRLFRNFSIGDVKQITKYIEPSKMHPVFNSFISWQRHIPEKILNVGLFSKFFMFLHFILHRSKI